MDTMKKQKKDIRLIIIFIQSLLAMIGSLYYSNFGDPVVNFNTVGLFDTTNALDPCNLCWWARILMYPIVAISGLALLKNETGALKYIILLAIPGACLEIYHYLLQKIDIATTQACTLVNPCSALKVDYFGFITIPFLCLVAFLVILMAATWKKK